MKRLMVFWAILAVMLSVSGNLTTAGETTVPVFLEKECVLIGRITDHGSGLLSQGVISEPVFEPREIRITGFDLLNIETGEWHPLSLSDGGFFCVNVSMGRYKLMARAKDFRPLMIRTVNVPRGMMVNIGTYRIEACDFQTEIAERWYSCLDDTYAGSVHFVHLTGDRSYENCDQWFSQCHEEVYEMFADMSTRR